MASILYCGDTDLSSAAAYLAGLISSWGWKFEYIPSHVAMTNNLLSVERRLLILSDYPAANFNADCQALALGQIERGCGLLMIGGWESYHGFGGNWDGTTLGDILPVKIHSTDDRINFEQSAWLLPAVDHQITDGLPWHNCPPAIGGMNRVDVKSNATVIMNAHSYSISAGEEKVLRSDDAPNMNFTHRETLPALVVGQYGSGRISAFLSDVAPHWVGGLVDWGLPRVTAQAAGAGAIEVGHHYAQFWKKLLQWTASNVEFK